MPEQTPTVQQVIAERISQSGTKVRETVIDKLAQVEIDKRVELVNKAIKKVEELEKELKKIDRADGANYTKTGERVEVMSESRYKDIQKAKEKLSGLTKVVDTALESNTPESYSKLGEALNKAGNVPPGLKEAGKSESKSEA